MVLTVVNFAILCSILNIASCSRKKQEEKQQIYDQYRQALVATSNALSNLNMLQSSYDTKKEVVERWESILANGKGRLSNERYNIAFGLYLRYKSELQDIEKRLRVARQYYIDLKTKENDSKKNWYDFNS